MRSTTTETERARKRKGLSVQSDTCYTKQYPVAHGYRAHLLTHLHSKPSRLLICRETKYFVGWRLLSGESACSVWCYLVNCSRHINQMHFNWLAKQWHTTRRRRISRCSDWLIQKENSREKWRKCISVTGSLCGQAQMRPIDKLDEACTNAHNWMMLVQHRSGDRVSVDLDEFLGRVYIYMSMHVCVCMCTCICVYVYIHIQVHIYFCGESSCIYRCCWAPCMCRCVR